MAITIDTVVLDSAMIWPDKYQSEELTTNVLTAINGREIVVSMPRGGHYPITLHGEKNFGWQKGSTVKALKALAVTGLIYTLTIGTETYNVRFRTEKQGGAVQFQKVRDAGPHSDTAWYYGDIYLMRVVV